MHDAVLRRDENRRANWTGSTYCTCNLPTAVLHFGLRTLAYATVWRDLCLMNSTSDNEAEHGMEQVDSHRKVCVCV